MFKLMILPRLQRIRNLLISRALGLRNEYTYKTEAEFSSLRYGRAVITTDADSDGDAYRRFTS